MRTNQISSHASTNIHNMYLTFTVYQQIHIYRAMINSKSYKSILYASFYLIL